MTVVTLDTLFNALCRKQQVTSMTPLPKMSAGDIADWIREAGIELSIMPGVRPAITFEAYFQALFGQKLDGSPVRRKRA
jgi:hypothetical protein